MSSTDDEPPRHTVRKEPKFCRCRVCHARFYAETIAEAEQACLAHARLEHPQWDARACFCPD